MNTKGKKRYVIFIWNTLLLIQKILNSTNIYFIIKGHFNNMHPAINGPSSVESTVVSITSSNNNSQSNVSGSSRQRSSNAQQQQQQQQPPMNQQQQQYSGGQIPLENGIDFRHSSRDQPSSQQIVR